MPIIKVLGSRTLIGKYFIDTNVDYELVCFSRKNKNHTFRVRFNIKRNVRGIRNFK